jgi:hypothetical protein
MSAYFIEPDGCVSLSQFLFDVREITDSLCLLELSLWW